MGRCITILCLGIAVAVAAAPLARASNWDEATDGDLSDNRLAPSALLLTPGMNTVTGSVIGTPSDIDYLTITVPTGYRLSSLDLLSFTSTDDLGFIGIQAGSTFTQPPTGTDVTQLLGWAHFGPNAPAPYLEVLGTAPGAIGFSGPLPAGPYTLWIQQVGTQLIGYEWGFGVTPLPAPEPAAAGLVLLGLGALLGRVANRFLGRAE